MNYLLHKAVSWTTQLYPNLRNSPIYPIFKVWVNKHLEFEIYAKCFGRQDDCFDLRC